MNTGLGLSLIGLALLDSTSIGTLFIPVWLLLSPGPVRVSRIMSYLAVITAFYFLVGVLIALGAGSLAGVLDSALDNPVVLWIQLCAGVALLAWSFRFDPRRRPSSGRVTKWRDRASSDSSPGWLAGLAVLAGLAEVATMLPYLAAIGMLTTADLAGATVVLLLAGYCVVMVLPAVLLLFGRVAVRSRIEPLLQRLNTWITEKATGVTGWVLGIAGFLIARDAVARLWFPQMLG